MFGIGKKHETEIILYSYEVEETSENTISDESDESITGDRHCAWCGNPPDENGSHGICTFHEEQMLEQSRARRRNRS